MIRLTAVAIAFGLTAFKVFAQHGSPAVSQREKKLQNSPVLFRENKGQVTDFNGRPVSSVLFCASARDAGVFVTKLGLTYTFSTIEEQRVAPDTKIELKDLYKPSSGSIEWINVHLKGADIRPENIVKEKPGSGDFRFFKPHCPEGITGVKEYAKITIREVYPGIDWVLYGSSPTGMKYDFIVHPGADPGAIQLVYEGDQPLTIDPKGNINIGLRLGNLTEQAPVSFTQDRHAPVVSAFESERLNRYNVRITYRLGDYPKNETLVIDPQLVWGTNFGGGSPDDLRANTHDGANALILTGTSASFNFPVLDAGTYFQTFSMISEDAVIVKFDSEGILLWSTFYGGNNSENGSTIVCDEAGNIFVAGVTRSADFPLQSNGGYYQTASPTLNTAENIYDAFILKFDNDGNREWATFYGGNHDDYARKIACDPGGNLFFVGSTRSTDFPVQDNGGYFQGTIAQGLLDVESDVFILKFDNDGNRSWATYYGGDAAELAAGIVCDANGNLFITGHTFSTHTFPLLNSGTYFQNVSFGYSMIFILKFDNSGNRLWATGYGGSNGHQFGGSIAIDADNDLFVTGFTEATNFPLQDNGTYFDNTYNGGINDVFILKFDNAGNRLWGTYFGGSSSDFNFFIANDLTSVDECGNLYHCFVTFSPDMTTLNAGGYFDGNLSGGQDAFAVNFTNDGDLLWSTYIGGQDNEYYIASEVDGNYNLYLTRQWFNGSGSLLYNPGNGAYYNGTMGNNAFIFKFKENSPVYTSETTNACGCSGSAVINVAGLTGPFTYEWSTGQVNAGDESSDTLSDLCPGDYWVLVSGCNGSDTIHMTVGAIVPVFTTETIVACGCDGSAIIQETAAIGPYTYQWSNGTTVTTNASSDTLTGLCPGDYTVVASACSVTDTLEVTVGAVIPSYNLLVNEHCGCSSEAIVAAVAGNAPFIFQWSNGTTGTTGDPADTLVNLCPGDYWVIATSCGVSDTIEWTITGMNAVYTPITVTSGCGCTGSASAGISGIPGPFNYHWSSGMTITTSAETHSVSNLCAGNGWVEITSCSGVDTLFFTLDSIPPPTADFTTSDTAFCEGNCVAFSAIPMADAIYTWDFGNEETSSSADATHCYGRAGDYTVSLLVSRSGCTVSATAPAQIHVYPQPLADFTADHFATSISDPEIHFTDQSTGSTAWEWSFGDALSGASDMQNPTYTYEAVGSYTVTLVVTNDYACSDTTQTTIVLYDDFAFYVPNSFSPNADGINDNWRPEGAGIDPIDYRLSVFNRWGELIWETRTWGESWDGTFNGLKSPDGVYTWEAQVLVKATPVRYNGSIALLK